MRIQEVNTVNSQATLEPGLDGVERCRGWAEKNKALQTDFGYPLKSLKSLTCSCWALPMGFFFRLPQLDSWHPWFMDFTLSVHGLSLTKQVWDQEILRIYWYPQKVVYMNPSTTWIKTKPLHSKKALHFQLVWTTIFWTNRNGLTNRPTNPAMPRHLPRVARPVGL